MQMVLLELKV